MCRSLLPSPVAWLVGYAVGRPILRLARATAAIRDLDLASARPLVRSGLRELDEAIGAYNALIATLRWFETYVPRNLVKRLMAQGDRAAALEERVVTVLFTDIAGFHDPGGAAARFGGGGVPQRALPPPRRLRGGRRRYDRQVHRRFADGLLGRARAATGPGSAGLPRRAGDRGHDRGGQSE